MSSLHPARLRANRLDIEYVEVGPAGGTNVILLHGNFGTWRWWAPALEHVPGGVRALAPTMRGCVGTRGSIGGYSLPVLAADVLAFADALGVERFHLVGHSLGGAIAVEVALAAPRRVTALDLVAPAPEDALSTIALSQGTRSVLSQLDPRTALGRATLVGLLRLARDSGSTRRYLTRVLRGLMPGADPMSIDFERLVADAAAMQPLAIVDIYLALAAWDIGERAQVLKVPTRVLAGAMDPLVPVTALDELAATLSGAFEVLSDAGHSPMLENPRRFMGWLERGLTAPAPVELSPPASAPRPSVWGALGRALGKLWSAEGPPAAAAAPGAEGP